ncbi:ABC transporter G family member 51-like [Andrographis paniculata]|uniref:ABC transporter G family member 51-like n=1 Tax=Andrographis paniculata TaxID=175694 RepID=UPI0021E91417|nr:ABC transporter G family member 51-like [Andrographis paniculata]
MWYLLEWEEKLSEEFLIENQDLKSLFILEYGSSIVYLDVSTSSIFLGINNYSTVQPGLVELPYIAVQAIAYSIITYFMMNYKRTAGKIFMYLLFMFLTFLYFTFFGMMVVGLTPTLHLAAVCATAFYATWELFSGFLIPVPIIPPWWVWLYYICPVAWTLRSIITSQLGDVETTVIATDFQGTVKEFISHQKLLSEGPGHDGKVYGLARRKTKTKTKSRKRKRPSGSEREDEGQSREESENVMDW